VSRVTSKDECTRLLWLAQRLSEQAVLNAFAADGAVALEHASDEHEGALTSSTEDAEGLAASVFEKRAVSTELKLNT